MVNNLATAKQQIAQAKTQIATAREQITKQRDIALKQKEILKQSKEKLPSRVSAKALRGNGTSGLKGRSKRIQIKKVEDIISKQQSNIKKSQLELKDYETKVLNPFEGRIKSSEAEVRKVEEYNSAVRQIEKAADKGMVWAHAFYGEGLVKKLAKRYMKLKKLERQSFSKSIDKFQKQNPNEKLIIDWKNLRIKGVNSGSLGQTVSLKNYNKKIKELQKVGTTNLSPKKLDVPLQNSKINVRSNLIGITGHAISELSLQSKIKRYRLPDKTTLQKIKSIPSRLLTSLRDFSHRQQSLVLAEKIVGVGNVASVNNKEIVGTLQISKKLDKLKGLSKKVLELDKSIKKLKIGNINPKNEFNGTSENFNKLKQLESQRDKLTTNIKDLQNIKIGLRDRNIQEFSKLNRNPITAVGSAVGLITADVAGKVGTGATKALNLFNYKPKVLGKKIDIPLNERIKLSREVGVKVAKGTETVLNVGKYVTPVGGLFFGADIAGFGADIAESKIKKEKITTQQKIEGAILGATVLTLGAIKGVSKYKSFRKFGKPSETSVEFKLIPLTKAKVVNVPREVKINSLLGEAKASTKGGSTLVYEPSGTIIETKIKGGSRFNRYFERQVQDPSGQVMGVIERPSPLGKYGKKYVTEYKYDPLTKTTEYKVFRDGKFIEKGTSNVGEKLFGLAEPKTASKVSRTLDKVKNKILTRKKLTTETFLQDVIPLKKRVKIIDINIPTEVKSSEVVKITPAKKLLGVRISSEKESGMFIKEIKSKVAKISKKGSKDFVNVGEKRILGDEGLNLQKVTAFKSPRFKQKALTSLEGSGSFKVIKQSRLDKLTDILVNPVINPTGRLYSFQSPTASLIQTFDRAVKVPKIKVTTPKLETEFAFEPKFKTETNTKVFTGSTIFERTDKVSQPVKLDSVTKQNLIVQTQFSPTKLMTNQKTNQKSIMKTKLMTNQKIDTLQKQQQKTKQQTKQKQLQKQIQRQIREPARAEQNYFTREVIKPKEPTPKSPKIKPKIKPKNTFKDLLNSIGTGEFKIKVRKGEEDIKIGQAKTVSEAKSILLKRLKGTLRASGFVEKGGRRVDLGFLGEGFRRGRKESKRVVEIKQKRIKRKGVSGEAGEIQFFRKKRGRKNGFF